MIRATWLIWTLVVAVASAARADRVVLAPGGRIVPPGEARAIYLWRTSDAGQYGRLHLGIPKDDLGLEVELDTYSYRGRGRDTFGLKYSIISEAFTNNIAPALSVGVLDLANRGLDGRAWYVSLSKTLGLSVAQERLFSLLRVHGGYGSHGMGGAYVGASVRVAGVLDLATELYRRKINAAARLRAAGPLGITVQTHDGVTWAGLDVVITR